MTRVLVVRLEQGLVNGLHGKYYTWKGDFIPEDFSSLEKLYERIDPQVNFVWWDKPAPNVPADKFAVEWTGYLRVEKTGLYRFYIEVDDGGRLWIDDTLLIDAWKEQPPTVYHSDIVELAHGFHKILFRFFNNEVFAVVRLGWITPDGNAEIIPSENLVTKKSDIIEVRGLPEKYRVELWSGEPLLHAIVEGDKAVMDASKLKEPVDAYFKIYDEKGELIGESPVIRDVWGGDVFEITVRKE